MHLDQGDHIFYDKASIVMEIPRLPSDLSWPLLMLTQIAGNEALPPTQLVVSFQKLPQELQHLGY
jgi:hypothetical protein